MTRIHTTLILRLVIAIPKRRLWKELQVILSMAWACHPIEKRDPLCKAYFPKNSTIKWVDQMLGSHETSHDIIATTDAVNEALDNPGQCIKHCVNSWKRWQWVEQQELVTNLNMTDQTMPIGGATIVPPSKANQMDTWGQVSILSTSFSFKLYYYCKYKHCI